MTEHIPLYPLALKPTLHTRVWGGRRLADVMGKTLPTDEPYGESWEVHDTSTIANGPLAGRALGEALAEYGEALAGTGSNPAEGFPLLVKLLDAADWLSIQVHPNDAQAAALEGEPRGKTEAWYVLDAAADAQLVIGIQPGTTRETMAAAIRENWLERLAVYASVKAGDALYMPAGTVHALGPGLLIYEIQQSSDLTYRLYDWGRMGLDGKPRQLHIEKGVSVSNLDTLPSIRHFGGQTLPETTIIEGEFFTTVLHRLGDDRPAELDTYGRRFHALTCIEGQIRIETGQGVTLIGAGQSAVVPAVAGSYRLAGSGEALRSWQGDLP